MTIEEIIELAEKANEANELNNSDVRYWIQNLQGEDRFFICYNILDMDDIEEVSKEIFIKKISKNF